jgi:hypothetical protein
LLTLPFVAIVVAILLGIGALLRARATAKRLARLTESYWELRYESGQLKARLNRLEVTAGLRDADPAGDAPAAPAKTTFVPLSSLKK